MRIDISFDCFLTLTLGASACECVLSDLAERELKLAGPQQIRACRRVGYARRAGYWVFQIGCHPESGETMIHSLAVFLSSSDVTVVLSCPSANRVFDYTYNLTG